MRFKHALAVLALCASPTFGVAQQEPVFESYDAMRAELDQMMMSREAKAVLLRFGGSSSMTEEDLDGLQTRIKDLYPYDFRHVAVIGRNEMENGFSQELYAYWTGLRYLYVLVLFHQRDDMLVAINLRFNTDFYELYKDL
jgi:hypothetical protein